MKTSEKWFRMGLRTVEEVKADKTLKLSKMQKAGKVRCHKNLYLSALKLDNRVTGEGKAHLYICFSCCSLVNTELLGENIWTS